MTKSCMFCGHRPAMTGGICKVCHDEFGKKTCVLCSIKIDTDWTGDYCHRCYTKVNEKINFVQEHLNQVFSHHMMGSDGL